MGDINRFAKENVLKFLIGNKSDLTKERKVKYEEARMLANQIDSNYYEVSAKINENINEFFETSVKIFLVKFYYNDEKMKNNNNVILSKDSVKDENKKNKKKDDNC